MTTSNEFFIFKSKEWIRGVEKFWMKNNFHSVVHAVEEIAATHTRKMF